MDVNRIKEIEFILNEMKENISIRNTLLTFCFTSVITIIGFGLTHFDEIPFVIYLIPIIITITFSCRIIYYKDKQCRMNAYLKFFYSDLLKHETIYTDNIFVGDFCTKNKFCSFIMNNELLILTIICSIIYYLKFDDYTFCGINYIFFAILPIILCIIQFLILNKVPSYTEKSKEYVNILQHFCE